MGFPFSIVSPSLAPAIATCVLFSLTFIALVIRTRQTNCFGVYIIASIFCAIRVAAYGCRIGWSQQANPQEITAIVYVAQILLAAGFIAVIFAEYNLFVAWLHLGLRRGKTPPKWENLMLKGFRALLPLIQIVTIVGAVLLLVSSDAGDLSTVATANTIRNASTYGFLGMSIVHVVLVVLYYWYFRSLEIEHLHNEHLFILLGMSSFVIIKLVYKTIAANRPFTDPINADERYFYCFDTLPEFLVMAWCVIWNLAEVKMGIEKPKKAKKGDIESVETEDQRKL